MVGKKYSMIHSTYNEWTLHKWIIIETIERRDDS